MKKYIIIILLFLTFLPIYSERPTGEISIWGAGGLSTLHYKSSAGTIKPYARWDMGISYTTFFNKNWGYGLGLELSQYKGAIKLGDYSDSYKTISNSIFGGSDTNNEFDFSVNYRQLRETQEATYLNIPIFYNTEIIKPKGSILI